jgi:hypothetical protein
MYAFSLVIPMKKIKNMMKKAKKHPEFENKQLILIGLDTLSTINDWTKQIEYAVGSFTFKKRSDKDTDDTIKNLLQKRLSKGFTSEIPLEVLESHKNSNRIEVVDQHSLIPINTSSQGIKNWHQLVELIYSQLPSVIELSDQVHQRSTTANSEFTEVIYWIINDRLEYLHKTITKIYNIQRFVTDHFNNEALNSANIMGEIANDITEVEKNA